MKITVHTLVKNEERYLWYAIISVIDYVDEILLWDTGSTDKTVEIIKLLQKKFPKKIKIKLFENVNNESFTTYRQQMLDETNTDWVLIVDGDEVWWDEKIKETTQVMRGKKSAQTLVNRYVNLIGDVYHYQSESAARYSIDNKVGNITVRAMNTKSISGLNVQKPHGQQGYFDKNGTLVQDLPSKDRIWIDDVSYMHFTHLVRSSSREEDTKVSKRAKKYKYEKGLNFPLNYFYPEAFFKKRSSIVPNVWERRNLKYEIKAFYQTPLREIKRTIPLPQKSGY